MKKSRIRTLLQNISDDPENDLQAHKTNIIFLDAIDLTGPEEPRPINGAINDISKEFQAIFNEWRRSGSNMDDNVVDKIYGLFQA